MLQNNKVNLVISIVAAIAIWAYVVVAINPDETKTIRNVPVSLKNVDTLQERGLTIVGEEDYTVDVEIKGPRSETSKITAEDIEATADVFGYPKGENEVRVVVTVPEKVSKENISPSTITITVDEYVTSSKSIRVKYEGNFEDNTEPGFVSVIPEEIEVSGAKSVVKNIAYVEAAVDSENVKDEESTIEVDAVPIDGKGNKINGLSLSQDKISVTCTLCYIKTVPLEVPIKGEVSSDYEVTGQEVPEEVTIKGVKSQIDKIAKLKSRSVNISDITETTEIPLKFNLPNKVELAEESDDISMIIEISGISVKDFTFSSSNIELSNVNDDYEAYLADTKVTVKVYGNKDVIDGLKKSDLTVSVDMTNADYSKNSYSGKVECTTDKSVNEIIIDPENIQVIINGTG